MENKISELFNLQHYENIKYINIGKEKITKIEIKTYYYIGIDLFNKNEKCISDWDLGWVRVINNYIILMQRLFCNDSDIGIDIFEVENKDILKKLKMLLTI